MNNRGLAALTMAGLDPSVTYEVPMNAKIRKRLADERIDRHHQVPGSRIAVTEQKDGEGHLYTVAQML